jgi:hypothetical protein
MRGIPVFVAVNDWWDSIKIAEARAGVKLVASIDNYVLAAY